MRYQVKMSTVRSYNRERTLHRSGHRFFHKVQATAALWGDERRAVMLPRSGRVGTIYTSAVEVRVRDRSRATHGALYCIQRYRSLFLYTGIGRGRG